MEGALGTSVESGNSHGDQPATEKPGAEATRGDSFDRVRLLRRQFLQDVQSGMIKGLWKPGHTIRLLHKVVHIRVSFKEGYLLDPKTRAPPKVPEIPSLSLEKEGVYAGMVRQFLRVFLSKQGANFIVPQVDDDAKECFYFDESTKESMWISQSGSSVYLRLKEYDIGDSRYQIFSEGMAVSPSCVIFNEKFDTEEKRQKVAENLNKQIQSQIQRQRDEYKKACKDYRINRRNWEIAVVRREWFTRKNYKLFRPGTTAMMVNAAIRKGEVENYLEEDGAFPLHYLGASEHVVATSNDGK